MTDAPRSRSPLTKFPDITYRRAAENMVWHFCQNCGNWPIDDFAEVTTAQHLLKGSLCLECIAKRHFGECTMSTTRGK
jgi:hypothetical protein